MRCENCNRGSFQPRVVISSIQGLLRLHHGHGTCNLDSSKIQQVLTDGEKDLADYATEISFLRSKILFIETKMENLRNHPGRMQVSLPDDILRLICYKKGDIVPPLQLSAVCSHWQSIMMSTALPLDHDLFILRCLSIRPLSHSVVQLYLERSKEALLDVSVSTRWNVVSLTGKRNHPAFQPLLDHSHRWRNVQFNGREALSLLHETASFYPALKSLGLFSDDLHQPMDFGVMPKLHSLTLYGLSSPLISVSSEAELPVHVVHGGVQTLKMFFPGLTSLHIEVAPDSPSEPWPATAMSAFFERSRFNLTVLSFTGVSMILLLHGITLHFPVTHTFISTLHAFQPNHAHCSAARLLPNLERLSLHARSEFNELTFVEMVTSRWIPDATYAKEIGVVCLRRVEARIGDDEYIGTTLEMTVDAKKLSPLKVLEQQGLIVDVINNGKYVEID
ncbi:hypothetical protein BT96DRAFT_925674 [Gymnopus androsaceus JB14]|uniref:F-box domain-containing protein n=1 Tax=Gymnopus androsaceus JB14 TaxID=1447944 RepID=A0A6A4GYC1_9AGAR|nr:hypothetical protein BT96DRAFT_925674 [Gymnopus androsaceus JB14]